MKNNARRMVSQRGEPVRHHFYDLLDDDGRETAVEADGSPETITAIQGETGLTVGFERNIRGVDVESRRVYHVRDDLNNDIRDTGGSGTSQLADSGGRWNVVQKDRLGNGLLRLITKRD